MENNLVFSARKYLSDLIMDDSLCKETISFEVSNTGLWQHRYDGKEVVFKDNVPFIMSDGEEIQLSDKWCVNKDDFKPFK